jgi:hypothetical protein
MIRSIDEQNEMIIKSRFGQDVRSQSHDTFTFRINEEMYESVKNHRKVNGITSKIAIIRNYIRTKKFVKTTMYV